MSVPDGRTFRLTFSDQELPKLLLTEFFLKSGPRTASFEPGSSASTLGWSTGAQSVALCFIEYLIAHQNGLRSDFEFKSTKGASPENTLADALENPTWINNFFGRAEDWVIKELFRPSAGDNRSGKGTGNIRVVRINHNFLPPECVKILKGGKSVLSKTALEDLAASIRRQWKPRRPSSTHDVEHTFDRHQIERELNFEAWPSDSKKILNISLFDAATPFRTAQALSPKKIVTLFCEAPVVQSQAGGQIKIQLLYLDHRSPAVRGTVAFRCGSSGKQPIVFAISKGRAVRLTPSPSADNDSVFFHDPATTDSIAVVAAYHYRMLRHIFGGLRDIEESYRGWNLVSVNDYTEANKAVDHIFLSGSPNDSMSFAGCYHISGPPEGILFHRTTTSELPAKEFETITRRDIPSILRSLSQELPAYFSSPPYSKVIQYLKSLESQPDHTVHWLSDHKTQQKGNLFYITESINNMHPLGVLTR